MISEYTRFIPTIEFPQNVICNPAGVDEPLVSLTEYGFRCDSQYYAQGIAGSLKDCYVRLGVAKRLKMAKRELPDGYNFKIYDGYRPIIVQRRLWDYYKRELRLKYPDISEEELVKRTRFFVSEPSYDVKNPSLHNTGGAIDLTLVDDNGKEYDMGTKFDDFSHKAWTNHFEPSYAEHEDNYTVMCNRRILYNAMCNAGFTNLPSEWWHYDYGTRFWGFFTGNQALYEGILDADLPDKFPLC